LGYPRGLTESTQIIEQAQADPRFLAVLSILFTLAQKYIKKVIAASMTLTTATKVTASDAHVSINTASAIDLDSHLFAVLESVKMLLERFSGYSFDILGIKLSRLMKGIAREGNTFETGLSAWLDATSTWLEHSLRHPGWVGTEEGRGEAGRLYDWVLRLLNEERNLKNDAQGVLDEVHAIESGLKEDRATSRVVLALKRLEEDMANFGVFSAAVATDISMKKWSQLKQELRNDVLGWLLPRILRVISVIPLPRVELKSDALDLVADRLTLSSPSFIPDHIHIASYSDTLLNASDATPDGSFRFASTTRSKIAIDGLRISARDIAYYVNAKGPICTGWLDNGLLTIDVGQQSAVGEGVKVEVELEFASRKWSHTDDGNLFKVLEVKVDVPGLKFTLDNSRHWVFNKVILQPLAGPIIRRLLSFVLSAQIRNGLDTLNRSLVEIQDTAIANTRGASPSFWDYLRVLLTQSRAERRSGEFQRSTTPSPSSSRFHGSDYRSESGSEENDVANDVYTRIHTEPTAKGIIRTSITGTADRNLVDETSIAVGIGEQILPGLGGPDRGPTPTLLDEAEALDEIDNLREQIEQGATRVAEQTKKTREIIHQRVERATMRLHKQREREEQNRGWRSNAFDL
jgi:hypothetical protein